MPFKLVKLKGGYKVKSQSGKTFSNKPLSEQQAKKQLTALNINYYKK